MIIVVSMTSQTGLYKVSKRLSQIVTFMMIQWKATNTLGLEEKASQMVLRKQLIGERGNESQSTWPAAQLAGTVS